MGSRQNVLPDEDDVELTTTDVLEDAGVIYYDDQFSFNDYI